MTINVIVVKTISQVHGTGLSKYIVSVPPDLLGIYVDRNILEIILGYNRHVRHKE